MGIDLPSEKRRIWKRQKNAQLIFMINWNTKLHIEQMIYYSHKKKKNLEQMSCRSEKKQLKK